MLSLSGSPSTWLQIISFRFHPWKKSFNFLCTSSTIAGEKESSRFELLADENIRKTVAQKSLLRVVSKKNKFNGGVIANLDKKNQFSHDALEMLSHQICSFVLLFLQQAEPT